jgi:drug/metabolite transporter (DMT)-like permease
MERTGVRVDSPICTLAPLVLTLYAFPRGLFLPRESFSASQPHGDFFSLLSVFNTFVSRILIRELNGILFC